MKLRVVRTAVAGTLLALAVVGLWRAAQPATSSSDSQVRAVATTLRCPTCQGLSVADSPSPLAQGMRDIIGEQLAAGRSADEVRAWFVERYGAWILLAPPSSGGGWLVWALPAALIVAGTITALRWSRTRANLTSVTDEDRAAAREALAAHARGELALPDTDEGDRLSAALAMLASVTSDDEDGDSTSKAHDIAFARVSAALGAVRVTGHPDEAPVRVSSLPTPAPRRARWALLSVAFTLVAAALLVLNTDARRTGDVLTGAPADDQVQARQARPQQQQQPPAEDGRNELITIAQLLQRGQAEEAARRAEAVVAVSPRNLDALLLLGVARAESGDPRGTATLRRFLKEVSPDHPGVPLARQWLRGDR